MILEQRLRAGGDDLFRENVTPIVRGYVDGPEELARELRHLLGA